MYNKITNYNMTRNKYWEQRKTYYDEPIYKPRGFVDHPILSELRYDTSPVYVENNKRRHFEPIYTMRGGGSDLDQTIINQYIQHKKNNKKDYEQLYRILAQKVNVEKHPERKQDTKMSKATNDILHVSQQALTHISKSKEETKASDDILRLAQQALSHAPVSSQEAHAQTKEETNATDDILRLAQQALTYVPTKEETNATDVITSQQETTSASVASASVASAPAEENTTSPPPKNDVLTEQHINTLKNNLLINKNLFTRKIGKITSNWLPYLIFMKKKLKGNNINLPEPMNSELNKFFTAHENLKQNYIKVKQVFDTKTLSDNDKTQLNQIKEKLNQIIEILKNSKKIVKSSKIKPPGTAI